MPAIQYSSLQGYAVQLNSAKVHSVGGVSGLYPTILEGGHEVLGIEMRFQSLELSPQPRRKNWK